MSWKVVPETKMAATSSSIMPDVVVWICDPESSWGDVHVQQTAAGSNKHCQVVLDNVLCLDTILQKVGVAHDIESNVALNKEMVDAVDGHSSVEGVMDATSSDIGTGDVAVHVVMDGVASETEGLSCMSHLNVLEPAMHQVLVLLFGKEHDLGTKLVCHSLCTKATLEACLGGKLICGGKKKKLLHLILARINMFKFCVTFQIYK